jgi:hypothetical protein
VPRGKRAKALFDAEGPSSASGLRLVGRMFLVARGELVAFLVIIALMVAKPKITLISQRFGVFRAPFRA